MRDKRMTRREIAFVVGALLAGGLFATVTIGVVTVGRGIGQVLAEAFH